MSKHTEAHPLAGQSVHLNDLAQDPAQGAVVPGAVFRVEDYWDRIGGKSWIASDGNPAAIHYGIRSTKGGLPLDDEVVYGKIGPFGHIVHVSELGGTVG